jgi:deuterolysin
LGTLQASLSFARSLAGGAASDIRSHPSSSTWNKFFAGNSQNDIWYRFDIIAGDLASSGVRKIYCNSDPANICSRAAAYTLVVRDGSGKIVGSDIYACESFYSFQSTPNVCTQNIDDINNSLGGVMLHELSHATSGTDDVAYGCRTVQSLSAAQKKNNADNYQCMALNIYRIYNC